LGDRCATTHNELPELQFPMQPGWATIINSGITNCQRMTSENVPTLNSLHTNQIVALNQSLMGEDMMKWCGKE
jgi:hypothetical protein